MVLWTAGVEAAVEGMAGEGGGVAYDDELHAGSCHCHVHAPEVAEKTDVAVGVAAHEGDYYDVAFLSLKAIDGVDGDQMAQLTEIWGILKQTTKILHLRPVRGYDSDIDSLVKEPLFSNFLYILVKLEHREESLVGIDPAVTLAGEPFSERLRRSFGGLSHFPLFSIASGKR